MKKILLLSDTHGHLDEGICKHLDWADEVWHAGDIGDISVVEHIQKRKTLRAVYGNIDGTPIRASFSLDLKFKCEGINVWMTHIAGYPKRYTPRVKNLLKTSSPDLLVCGHSHILKVMRDKKLNMLYMNPGAFGKYGFHQVRTMLRFIIDGKQIKNLEVVEFKR